MIYSSNKVYLLYVPTNLPIVPLYQCVIIQRQLYIISSAAPACSCLCVHCSCVPPLRGAATPAAHLTDSIREIFLFFFH